MCDSTYYLKENNECVNDCGDGKFATGGDLIVGGVCTNCIENC